MATTPTTATENYNTAYLRTPAGVLRIAEGLLAVVAIICCAEGSRCDYPWNDGWNYGFYIVIWVISLMESIFILIMIVLRYEKKITVINIPLSLLLNDAITIMVCFLVTVLMMLRIGRCHMAARTIAMFAGIASFLTAVGLTYTDYRWWQGIETPDNCETKQTTNGIPVTSSSTAVLTLS